MKITVLRSSCHSSSSWFCRMSRVWRVERTERLVHEDDFGIVDQRADDVGALAHAAGELVRIAVLEAVEPDAVDEAQRALAPLRGRHAAQLERKFHVLAAACARDRGCRPA